MASTYVNDLRLNEMGTGDASGTWGTVTNTNLELIGEALGYGTEAISTNADTHTSTVADGATDPARSMYIKYTGTLDSACTITIAPNTLSRVHIIENGTSGSQNIIISQGSGANVTIPPGDTKAVYLDGAGSGAAVVDAFASLSVVDLKVQDDLTVTDDASIGGALTVTGIMKTDDTTDATSTTDGSLQTDGGLSVAKDAVLGNDVKLLSDSSVLSFGADSDATLTHTNDVGLTLNSTNKLMFNDASQFIQGASATVLDIAATDEIELTATLIDVVGNFTNSGTLVSTGKITADAGIDIDNFNIDGTTIALSSGDMTLDVAGNIILDADGADIRFTDGGTEFGRIYNSSSDMAIYSAISDQDMKFQGNDGGSVTTALTLDMSDDGSATFKHNIQMVDAAQFRIGNDNDLILGMDGTEGQIYAVHGNLLLDAEADVIVDAKGRDVIFKADGTETAKLHLGTGSTVLSTSVSDHGMSFNGNDGGSTITALTLQMASAGRAVFNAEALARGAVVQRKYVSLTSTTQLTRAGTLAELSTSLRIAFTPFHSSSVLYAEVSAWFCIPFTNDLVYAQIYDVTNSEVPSLPPSDGSRQRVHYSVRHRDFDANDFGMMTFMVPIAATNTDARTYTLFVGTEGTTLQFLSSTLSSASGVNSPVTFSITEIYNP
mgnify:CR=1 FL=1|tara:strand:+ start:628 stop:2616 length:1989 start_codon:yes stop_codon:yes gene_type:complete